MVKVTKIFLKIICIGFVLFFVSCTNGYFRKTPVKPESSLFLGLEESDIKGAVVKLFYDGDQVIAIYVEGKTEENPVVDKAIIGISEETNIYILLGDQSIASTPDELGKGQIVKVQKNAKGVITREILTQNWTDWIDYWAVDFNFESKREIIRVNRSKGVQTKLDGTAESTQLSFEDFEEVWTGEYIFENEWQSFRTKKDRSLELISVARECPPGRRKIAVKVVDIFGNDTMTIVTTSVGGKK